MSGVICECGHGIDGHGDNGCIHCKCSQSRTVLELREEINTLRGVIKRLLSFLPDSDHTDDCWDWCWEELNGKAQDAVKSARRKADRVLSKTGGEIKCSD